MSDAEADAAASRDDVWVEKYRPQRLADVAGHESITERIQQYVDSDDVPNMLFAGPAGTGKCVSGETPVLTSRGVERIQNVVGDASGFEDPDEDLEVLSLDRGEFEYIRPSKVFGKSAEETVCVATRDGGRTTTTPEHRYLVVNDSGFEWCEAENLEPGDRVARPLRAASPPTDASVQWIDELDGSRTHVHVSEEFARRHDIPVEEAMVGKKKRAVRGFRHDRTDEEIAQRESIRKKTVSHYRRTVSDLETEEASRVCSLDYLRSLDVARETLRNHVEAIQFVTVANNRSVPVTPVWECRSELAEFLGLAVSEARIERARIKFYNTDEKLLERFEELSSSLFGVEPKRGVQQGVGYVEVQSRSLLHYLESCFDVVDLENESGIGSQIVCAPRAARAAFVRAMFDAEAHVTPRGTMELTQKKESYVTLLSYLLATFGIPSRRTTKEKAATNGTGIEREYHVLFVSGSRHLERFREAVGFTVDDKANTLDEATRDSPNPNHDTVPAQDAVDTLCEALYLPKDDLCSDSLDPQTPGRVAHLEEVDEVLDAAAERIEAAQEVMATMDRLRPDLRKLSRLQTTWIAEREVLEPVGVRNELEESVGARSDSLLRYARGENTPTSGRLVTILEETGTIDDRPPMEGVQSTLRRAIERLGVPYNHVASGTDYRGAELINLLEGDDLALKSLSRFETVAERIAQIADGLLTEEVLASLQTLEVLSENNLYFDEVVEVDRDGEQQRVYDLTVPRTHNYVAGAVPTVMHNTTTALAIAREVYGEDWQEHFLELNASDQRGIDVVRGRIKDFARSSMSTEYDFRIIFLDEADALTSDAQSALRRTMEQFSSNTRFILSCNYSSRIIDPIQSRCAVFRFPPLSDDAVIEQVREVAEAEGIEVAEDGYDALAYVADGDMRRAINALQAAATTGTTVDEDGVYEITSTARPEEVLEMVEHAMDGDFLAARAALEDLLIGRGIAGGDVIDQLHRSVWDLEIEEAAAVRLMDRVGEAEYRIVEGADERIQLEAMLASLALEE